MYKIIKNIQAYAIFLACILPYCPSVLGEDMVLVPSAVNLDSELGGGTLSPEEIIQKVRDAELKVAIFADKDNNRVEYGIPPLSILIWLSSPVLRQYLSIIGTGQSLQDLRPGIFIKTSSSSALIAPKIIKISPQSAIKSRGISACGVF